MPKQTKSSIHRKGPAPKQLHYCVIPGCRKVFKNQTDLSRHKWRHLPDHLYPTCPFVGPFGHRCQVKYKGRASDIRIHWERDHGPYPSNVEFPSLASILFVNNIDLGEDSSPTPTPHTGPPASSSHQVAGLQMTQEGHSLGTMQPHIHLPPNQYQFAAVQEHHVVQQEYVQSFVNNGYETIPIYPSSDNGVQTAMSGHPPFINVNSPVIPQYALTPNYSVLDYGGHHEVDHGHPVSGQYQHVPPFHLQVENQGWDFSLGDPPSASTSTLEPEWNQFEMYLNL